MADAMIHAGQAPNERDRRIPSLDGWRAISIVLVILAHATRSTGFPQGAFADLSERFSYAALGVRVFFVISGFLITGILLRELRTTGSISLRRFYLRRAFRIFPPFYAYVAVMVALGAIGALPKLSALGLLHVVTYTVNYASGTAGTWMTSHFWSLSIEEQFYFLWPPILAWFGARRGFRAALAFVVLSPAIRLGLYYLVPSYHQFIGVSFETSADAIVTGCLLAWYRDDLWRVDRYRRFLGSRWMLLVPAVILLAALVDSRPRLTYAFGIPIKNLGIAMLLDWSMRYPSGAFGRFLNARAVCYVGVLSYSLYIWQQVFLFTAYASAWLRFPVNLIWVAAAAGGSYFLIERPALRLRARIEKRDVRRTPAPAVAEGGVG